jgi:hypothetical protein
LLHIVRVQVAMPGNANDEGRVSVGDVVSQASGCRWDAGELPSALCRLPGARDSAFPTRLPARGYRAPATYGTLLLPTAARL